MSDKGDRASQKGKQQDSNNGIVPQQFRIMNIINSGSFGTVFQAIEKNLKMEVAVKVLKNPDKDTLMMLEDEIRILKDLSNIEGVPKIISYGNNSNYQYVAMTLLDKDLGFYFAFCQKRFSIKTVLMLSIDLLTIMEQIHDAGYIHRDLKPENMMMGKGKDDRLYVVDFGMSKAYINMQTKEHIEPKALRQFVGTYRYCAITAHHGNEQSRKDDLESLGYILIYFAKGKLPWQGINSTRKEYVQNMKQTIKLEELTKGLPSIFLEYMKYVKSLGFKDRPDYKNLIAQFKNTMKVLNYQQDGMFDWKIQKMRRNQQKNRNNTVIIQNSAGGFREGGGRQQDTILAQRQGSVNAGGGGAAQQNLLHKTASHNVINFGNNPNRRGDRFGTMVSHQTMMTNGGILQTQPSFSRSGSKKPSLMRNNTRAKTKKSTFFTTKQFTIEEKESVDAYSSKFQLDAYGDDLSLEDKIMKLNHNTTQPKFFNFLRSRVQAK
ncbi:hypothetical protein ABPG74_000446 [Tetrahymena malaccensis]